MPSTVLQLVSQACAEMGLSVPTTLASNTSRDAIQLLGLINAVGYELQREFTWQALGTEYQFSTQFTETTGILTDGSAVVTGIPSTAGLDTTYAVVGTGINSAVSIRSVDSATQVTLTEAATESGVQTLSFCKVKYAFPTGFDRLVDRTDWDKTKHWEMLGPETAQQWAFLKSGFIATGPRIRFRPLGGFFQIYPPVASTELLGFEYVSSFWAKDNAGTAKAAFTADTDTCIFPDRLMVVGLKLKFFEAKQFDSTAHNRDYIRQLDIAKANDAGSQTLSMTPRLSDVLISWDQIPDTGFGSSN